jgi:hypothetical protein
MSQLITIAQAFEQWENEIKPAIAEQYGEDDATAMSESWNDYTDTLCKDGQLTDLQCHYCPAYDDPMPDDDRAFILESMGVNCTPKRIDTRPDSLMDDMPAGSSHYAVEIARSGRDSFTIFYSMGPAYSALPSDTDYDFSTVFGDHTAAVPSSTRTPICVFVKIFRVVTLSP